MRNDNIGRHMKVHEKTNEDHPRTERKLEQDDDKLIKRKCNEIDVSALRKMLEKETVRYKNKIALGKALDKILGEGKVMT